ncbi:Uncharacterized protein Adt_39378 [Abeliophyllum distichum]|uniref:Uncharacterized protein n=1 Tax=Abeliophyllum distichum TaxID=126358 RepID=A0ABD1Q4X2_9LAMI
MWWSKIADTPHKIYSQLVHEFYTNFNQEIDIQGTEHYGKTWVRGKWFMFTPRIINDYYGITTDDIHHLPSIQDMGEVALVFIWLRRCMATTLGGTSSTAN